MYPHQKVLQHKINTKIKLGLVASYDLQSANETCLFRNA